MENFKDILKEDISNTFLNLDEFAENIEFDNQIIVGCFDTLEQMQLDKNAKFSGNSIFHRNNVVLYIKEDDLKDLNYSKSQEVIVNKEQKFIKEISIQNGIMKITFEEEGI